jgi:hypothetical protein
MRPAQRGEIVEAGFFGGELFGYFYQVHGSPH